MRLADLLMLFSELLAELTNILNIGLEKTGKEVYNALWCILLHVVPGTPHKRKNNRDIAHERKNRSETNSVLRCRGVHNRCHRLGISVLPNV